MLITWDWSRFRWFWRKWSWQVIQGPDPQPPQARSANIILFDGSYFNLNSSSLQRPLFGSNPCLRKGFIATTLSTGQAIIEKNNFYVSMEGPSWPKDCSRILNCPTFGCFAAYRNSNPDFHGTALSADTDPRAT